MADNSAPSARLVLPVSEDITLTPFRQSDASCLARQLNNRQIYEGTATIPFPYTEEHAHGWLDITLSRYASGQLADLAIRRGDQLLGGIGFSPFDGQAPHRAEIGYWLAPNDWGKGIMTNAVNAACAYAFERLSLHKITAHVFTRNAGSIRVLRKCGFSQEGLCRQHFRKDGELIDAWLFAKLASDPENAAKTPSAP